MNSSENTYENTSTQSIQEIISTAPPEKIHLFWKAFSQTNNLLSPISLHDLKVSLSSFILEDTLPLMKEYPFEEKMRLTIYKEPDIQYFEDQKRYLELIASNKIEPKRIENKETFQRSLFVRNDLIPLLLASNATNREAYFAIHKALYFEVPILGGKMRMYEVYDKNEKESDNFMYPSPDILNTLSVNFFSICDTLFPKKRDRNNSIPTSTDILLHILANISSLLQIIHFPNDGNKRTLQDFIYFLSLRGNLDTPQLLATSPYRDNNELHHFKLLNIKLKLDFIQCIHKNLAIRVPYLSQGSNEIFKSYQLPTTLEEAQYFLLENGYLYTILELMENFERNPSKPILPTSLVIKSAFANSPKEYQIPKTKDLDKLHKLKAINFQMRRTFEYTESTLIEEFSLFNEVIREATPSAFFDDFFLILLKSMPNTLQISSDAKKIFEETFNSLKHYVQNPNCTNKVKNTILSEITAIQVRINPTLKIVRSNKQNHKKRKK